MNYPCLNGLDPLAELQLRVARRADQLATARRDRSLLNLPCWLQAEEEILGSMRRRGIELDRDSGAARGEMMDRMAHA